MAHWHDSNPWATRLIYVADLEDLVDALYSERSKATAMQHWYQHGTLLDGYLLPQPRGQYEAGIRYGAEGADYISLYCKQEKLRDLALRYRNSGA